MRRYTLPKLIARRATACAARTFGKVNIALFVFGSPLLSLSDPSPDSFFFPSLHSPFEWKSAIAEYVIGGMLSPSALRWCELVARTHFTKVNFLLYYDPTLPSFFRHYIPPSPWERDGVRILFLSPRNPVFTVFSPVVSHYDSTVYTSFLYQSSKIRISFL